MENADIGARITAIIKSLDIKKVFFAEKLKIDQSYVTQLTNGRRKPSDRLINAICREFNVNEDWLRTGAGGNQVMFLPTSTSVIGKFAAEMNMTERDRVLIEKFLALPEEGRQAVMDYALSVAEAVQGNTTYEDDTTEAAEAAYRSSSGYVPSADISALNTTGGKERTRRESETTGGAKLA